MLRKGLLVIATVMVLLVPCLAGAQQESHPAPLAKVAVLWTSGDPDVARYACLMYAHNAKLREWVDEVALIIWGPSAKLLAEDEALQAKVRAMADDGVALIACKACADHYGVSQQLEALGVDVKYFGVGLTEMLMGDWKVITY